MDNANSSDFRLWTLAVLVAGGMMLAGCSDQSALTRANEPMLSSHGGPGGPGGPPPHAGGPGNGNASHAKATGGIGWEAGGFAREASFQVHDDAPGKNPDRGSLEYKLYNQDGSVKGSFRIEVECVEISGNTASFAGPAVNRTGFYASPQWATLRGKVEDGGSPGAGNDRIRVESGSCNDLDNIFGGGTVSTANSGNLTVHN